MALMAIGGGFQLNTPAALSYLRARQAGLPPGITTATRSYDLQMTWYKNQGKPGYPKWADHPDRSKHVYRPNDIKDQGGRALDLPAGGPREWMTKNGEQFGWFRRIKVEPWHFEYEEWNDPSRNTNQGDDDVSVADVRVGIAGLLDEAANRSTPTGRAVGDDLIAIIAPLVKTIVSNTWATTVARGGKNISVLQEIADAKTLALQINSALSGLQNSDNPGYDPEKVAEVVRTVIKEELANSSRFDINVEVVPKQ